MMKIFIKNIVFFLVWLLYKIIPAKIRILYENRHPNVGFLDYKKSNIKIVLNSAESLKRLKSCKKEPETIKWIENIISENEVLYDIGANIGAYSLVACVAKNRKIKVISFEPSASTFQDLCKNIILNNMVDVIVPFNIALSSSNGFFDFIYSSFESGAASHFGLENSDKDFSRGIKSKSFKQHMITYKLDDLIAELKLPIPNHIKIDVDGHELSVLKGATETLHSKIIKSIQIEIDESEKETLAIVEFLNQHGFIIGKKNQHLNSTIYDCIFLRGNI